MAFSLACFMTCNDEISSFSWAVSVCLSFFNLPPLAVLLHDGCGVQFLINIILYFLGIVPGAIHAIWLIFFANR
uniref:UPF0057-domain-containing protein n=1 Tax=Syphacia muris TaxID=451379 RepID=A0A0N5AX17_9BILA